MTGVFVSWGISAAVLIISAAAVGQSVKKNPLGIFLDSRGRASLSQFQLVMWTLIVLSLLAGVFLARLFGRVAEPLEITIPGELLIVMGISGGSAVSAGAIKAGKDLRGRTIMRGRPGFRQLLTIEEGTGPEVVDVTKFQNFWLTVIVMVAYVAAALAYVAGQTKLADVNALPGFSGTLLTLLGISHAGYLAGKLPDRQ